MIFYMTLYMASYQHLFQYILAPSYFIDSINLPLDPPPHHPQVGLGQSPTRCAAYEANRAVAFLPSER